MFVQFTDNDGRETWINPVHVKVVRTNQGFLGGKKGSEIWFSFGSSSEAIYVPQSPSEATALLDAAMPPTSFVDAGDDSEDDSTPKSS